MKLLGHAWVAVNSVTKGNRKLLILGSILPEIMYYTVNHPFLYEEIHEGGDRVYLYLKMKKPEWTDLGLGMLAHSAKMGADDFNFDENLKILGYEGKKVEELREKLTEVLGITYETAKTRVHNILELAVELRIIKENPEFIEEFNNAIGNKKVRNEIKMILADCSDKDLKQVSKSVDELLNKVKPEYYKDAQGLARLWAELSRDFDPRFDARKLADLLTQLQKDYQGKDIEFLSKCVNWTKKNIESFESN